MAAVLPQRDPCVEGKKTSPPPVRLMLIRARASLSHDKALISASSGWTRSACVRRVGRDLFCGLPSPLKIRTQRKREGMWRAGGACQRRNGRNSLSVAHTIGRELDDSYRVAQEAQAPNAWHPRASPPPTLAIQLRRKSFLAHARRTVGRTLQRSLAAAVQRRLPQHSWRSCDRRSRHRCPHLPRLPPPQP